MKILHITKKYPRALGGDAVVVANLQKQQQAAGHTVVIVTSACDDIKNGKHIYKCGLKDTAAGLDAITIKRIISLVILLFRAFTILRKEQPDIIHTHSVDMAFFVSFAARWYQIPLIHTFHIVTFYDRAQSRLRRKSELWLAKNAKPRNVTAPNTYDVEKLVAAGLKQTVLLPNGIDIAQWEPYGYTEKNNIPTFVSVGRLEHQKGYEYLIKAAALVANSQSLQIIIVGEGSQKEALQQLAKRLRIEDSVIFAGGKSPREIRTLLAEAHVAVFPSLYETTPLTLLEAWASGVSVIASPVGILRDLPFSFDAACIVPSKDEHALAAAMQRDISNTFQREARAAAGRKEVEKYAWTHIAPILETLYKGAL